jgi:hypothetical protein
MPSTTITETGCYLDNHRGHYITRDAILLAQGLGFIVGEFERFALDHYDDLGHEEGVSPRGPDRALRRGRGVAQQWAG